MPIQLGPLEKAALLQIRNLRTVPADTRLNSRRLIHLGLVNESPQGLRLTPAGEAAALEAARQRNLPTKRRLGREAVVEAFRADREQR